LNPTGPAGVAIKNAPIRRVFLYREFAALDTPILIADPQHVRATFTLDELLPQSFGPEHLRGS
jgi:cytidine deaminase